MTTLRSWLIAAVSLLALACTLAVCLRAAPAASAAGAPCFAQLPPVPGVPPWGFHTGAPITGASGSYARAAGEINLGTNWISGTICQDDRSRGVDRLIVMRPESHILSHTHTGVMYGDPGNIIVVDVKVISSNDATCAVGTIGRMVMFGSYNGVRSDSIQFRFGAACASHDHLYHGAQVNAQVPPL